MSSRSLLGNVTDLYDSEQTTDWSAAVGLEIKVTGVDGEGLGICLAEQDSITQGLFLLGLLEGFSRFDDVTARGKQLYYIAEALKAHSDRDTMGGVAGLLRELVAFLEDGAS